MLATSAAVSPRSTAACWRSTCESGGPAMLAVPLMLGSRSSSLRRNSSSSHCTSLRSGGKCSRAAAASPPASGGGRSSCDVVFASRRLAVSVKSPVSSSTVLTRSVSLSSSCRRERRSSMNALLFWASLASRVPCRPSPTSTTAPTELTCFTVPTTTWPTSSSESLRLSSDFIVFGPSVPCLGVSGSSTTCRSVRLGFLRTKAARHTAPLSQQPRSVKCRTHAFSWACLPVVRCSSRAHAPLGKMTTLLKLLSYTIALPLTAMFHSCCIDIPSGPPE